jgi:DNA-binding transcriptional MerR regulator
VSKYRIRTVAQLTGLSPALIRAWEARYSLVAPTRTAAGYRLYSDEDVQLLQGAQRLVQQGISPMQVARLPRQQIRQAKEDGASAHMVPPAIEAQSPLVFAELIDRLLEAFAEFDTQRAEELLSMPLTLLSPTVACQKFLVPLLREIGERWHGGSLSVAAEHFGTSMVRGKLTALLETMRHRRKGPRVICACPPGEQHEAGLLMFAIEAATQGWDTVYLGANVPLADLGAVVKTSKPDLVALSLVLRREADDLYELLTAAQAELHGACPLLVGGRGLFGHEEVVRRAGCQQLPRSGLLADLLPKKAS